MFLARANLGAPRGGVENVYAALCRSLTADVDKWVKRCSGVDKAGVVSMFNRYFSAQQSSTPCN